jgi:hypothetical protein
MNARGQGGETILREDRCSSSGKGLELFYLQVQAFESRVV